MITPGEKKKGNYLIGFIVGVDIGEMTTLIMLHH
jgi:hypothetical protein